MQGANRHLVSFLLGVAENIAAYIAVAAIMIIIGVLYTVYSNDPVTALLWVVIALVALNCVGVLAVLRQQRDHSKWRSKGILLQDDQNRIPFLVDTYGKARQIPDAETLSYLGWALGIAEEPPVIPIKEVIKLRGEPLPSIKDWKRPLTPQEQEARELHFTVSRMLRIEAAFDETATPQTIRITITNSGKELIHVEKATFQHHELPEAAVSPRHGKEGMYTVVPFDESAANVSPDSSLTMELELAQAWHRRDIDRIKGRWGFLLLDAVYRGRPIERMLYPI